MKALARYQIILLGEQRHIVTLFYAPYKYSYLLTYLLYIGVNNLPKVVARQCSSRESNPRSIDHESSALTTTPPRHHFYMEYMVDV